MAATATTYEIEGRTVTMPVEVRDASAGFATFLVPRRPARALLPDDVLDLVPALPGRTLLGIGLIDYHDNDLGSYHEVAILLFVRPRAGGGLLALPRLLRDLRHGRLGTYIWQLPVDETFTLHAGREIWGFPKWLADIDVADDPGRWRGRLAVDGQHVLTLDLPRGGRRSMPPAETATYTRVGGAWHRTAMRQQAREVGFRTGLTAGARLELGSHPIAETLRGLGLPRRPVGTLWVDGMHSVFEVARPLPQPVGGRPAGR